LIHYGVNNSHIGY